MKKIILICLFFCCFTVVYTQESEITDEFDDFDRLCSEAEDNIV